MCSESTFSCMKRHEFFKQERKIHCKLFLEVWIAGEGSIRGHGLHRDGILEFWKKNWPFNKIIFSSAHLMSVVAVTTMCTNETFCESLIKH